MRRLNPLNRPLAQRLRALSELGDMHELIDSWRWEPVEMSEAQVARVLSLVRERLIPEAEGLLERVPMREAVLLLLSQWRTLALELEDALRK